MTTERTVGAVLESLQSISDEWKAHDEGQPRTDEHLWFITSSGKKIFVRDPRPEVIDIEDIAHALSMLCRFGGHCLRFYSVAQHSVHVSQLVPPGQKLRALLHDASEAYLGDVIRPLKRELSSVYGPLEKQWERAICQRFGIDPFPSSVVKRADIVALVTERRDLINPTVHDNYAGWIEDDLDVHPHPIVIVPRPPEQARQDFLDAFERLRHEVQR